MIEALQEEMKIFLKEIEERDKQKVGRKEVLGLFKSLT